MNISWARRRYEAMSGDLNRYAQEHLEDPSDQATVLVALTPAQAAATMTALGHQAAKIGFALSIPGTAEEDAHPTIQGGVRQLDATLDAMALLCTAIDIVPESVPEDWLR